ncbi:NlpC/P60 family protein [Streptomyces sp. MBT49]|uniref:C40 family peptidase n=1 Tax=Streptomyces sp. MBT49 TaxID=1488380 RepID=UPI0035AB74D9
MASQHRKPRSPGTRVAGIRTPGLATAAFTSVALLSQTANAAPSDDGTPSLEEVEKKVDDLYRRAESATEKSSTAKERAPRQRRQADAVPDDVAQRARGREETRERPGSAAAARYRTGASAPEKAASLLATAPRGYFDQDQLMSRLSERRRNAADGQVTERSSAAGRRQEATGSAAATDPQNDLRTAKAAVQKKLGDARELLSALTARENARLAAVERQRREDAAELARQQAAAHPAEHLETGAGPAGAPSPTGPDAWPSTTTATGTFDWPATATTTAAADPGGWPTAATATATGPDGWPTMAQATTTGDWPGTAAATEPAVWSDTTATATPAGPDGWSDTATGATPGPDGWSAATATEQGTWSAAATATQQDGWSDTATGTTPGPDGWSAAATATTTGDWPGIAAAAETDAWSGTTAAAAETDAWSAATGGTPSADHAYVTKAEKALAFARAQIGKPCVWGAAGPGSYDCSGLAQAAWRAAGVTLPRTAHDQATAGTTVPLADARPGDLLFFHDDEGHVGVHSGNGMMIHAPGPGTYVREEPVHHDGASAVRSVLRPA